MSRSGQAVCLCVHRCKPQQQHSGTVETIQHHMQQGRAVHCNNLQRAALTLLLCP